MATGQRRTRRRRTPTAADHLKKLLCPEHYMETHPPQPPEILECHICGKKLVYRCITCQGYEDDWLGEEEVVAQTEASFNERTKPEDFPYQSEIKKTIGEWYQQKKHGQDNDGITEEEHTRLVGDIINSKNGIIPDKEIRERKYYTLDELKMMLERGWDAYEKDRDDKEEANTEQWKENIKNRIEREKAEAARKEAEREAKRARKQGIGVQSGLWVLIKFQPKTNQRQLTDVFNTQTIEVNNCQWVKGDKQTPTNVNLITVDKTNSEHDWDAVIKPLIINQANNWVEVVLNPFTQNEPAWHDNNRIEIHGKFLIRMPGEGYPNPSPQDIVLSFTPDNQQEWLLGAQLGFRQDPNAAFIKCVGSYYNLAQVDTIMVLRNNSRGNWATDAGFITTNIGKEIELHSKIINGTFESGDVLGNMVVVMGQFAIVEKPPGENE